MTTPCFALDGRRGAPSDCPAPKPRERSPDATDANDLTEDLILDRAVQGRAALEAHAQAGGDAPRLAGPPEALARLAEAHVAEVAEALRAGGGAQEVVDTMAFLLAIGEDHVGAEAIRAAVP